MKFSLDICEEIFEIDEFNKIKTNYKCPLVYCFYNKLNKKLYIGSSNNMLRRFVNYYLAIDKRYSFHSVLLKRAFNKYKREGFLFCIIEKLPKNSTKEFIIAREQYFIDLFNPVCPKGYNLCSIANSNAGRKVSKSTRKKLSLANIKNPTNAKLQKHQIIEIFLDFIKYKNYKYICSKYGIKSKTVEQILHRRTWRHVKIEKDILDKAASLFQTPKTTLKQAKRICKLLLKKNLSCNKISKLVGVCRVSVENINKGLTFPQFKEKYAPNSSHIYIPDNIPISDKQINKIIKDYKDDIILKDLSIKYKINKATIRKVLQKNNVFNPVMLPITYETAFKIGEMLLNNKSNSEISEVCDVESYIIQGINKGKTFKEVKLKLNPKLPTIRYSRKSIPLSKMKLLVRCLKRDLGIAETERATNFSRSFIYKWMRMFAKKHG